MSDAPILVIPEEAKEALQEPLSPMNNPLPEWIVASIRAPLFRAIFGPTMRPSFQSRLLMWTSRAAINAHDHCEQHIEAREKHVASIS